VSAFRLDGVLERALREVRDGVEEQAAAARDRWLGVPEISGKLLRPLIAYALVPESARDSLDAPFWSGALAVQMVHEASLLHDDILDGADLRRGRATVQARSGIASALVLGDRYLTSAYVVASGTRSRDFMEGFALAVERTVAGEMRQGATRGQILDEEAYEAIIRGKSGELFGACALLSSVTGRAPVPAELGLAIGSLYQRVDDLLDYCTEIEQDKPALQDWRQRKWTFPLGLAGVDRWDLRESELLARLRTGPHPVLLQGVEALEAQARAIVTDAARSIGDTTLLEAVLESWCAAARRGVESELATLDGEHSRPLDQAS